MKDFSRTEPQALHKNINAMAKQWQGGED